MGLDKTKVISLFSGCGGADLGILGGFTFLNKGYKKNALEIIHASDIEHKAINTYNYNFKHNGLCEDIKNLDFRATFADIVVGGFPCQNFSTVNPLKDPENRDHQLFWEMARVVSEVKPKAFIAENVRGFAYLKKGKYLNLALDAFKGLGYTVRWDILNSSHYGIPQLRQRVIMVGIRNDIDSHELFKFPRPTHGEHLKKPVPLSMLKEDDATVGEKYYFSKKAVEGVKRAKPNMKRALAQDVNKPCLTITSHLAKVSLNSRDPVLLVDALAERYRRFTPLEAARIQSFPDSFVFMGSEADAYRQIGNAVPPVLMWKIINQLLPHITS